MSIDVGGHPPGLERRRPQGRGCGNVDCIAGDVNPPVRNGWSAAVRRIAYCRPGGIGRKLHVYIAVVETAVVAEFRIGHKPVKCAVILSLRARRRKIAPFRTEQAVGIVLFLGREAEFVVFILIFSELVHHFQSPRRHQSQILAALAKLEIRVIVSVRIDELIYAVAQARSKHDFVPAAFDNEARRELPFVELGCIVCQAPVAKINGVHIQIVNLNPVGRVLFSAGLVNGELRVFIVGHELADLHERTICLRPPVIRQNGVVHPIDPIGIDQVGSAARLIQPLFGEERHISPVNFVVHEQIALQALFDCDCHRIAIGLFAVGGLELKLVNSEAVDRQIRVLDIVAGRKEYRAFPGSSDLRPLHRQIAVRLSHAVVGDLAVELHSNRAAPEPRYPVVACVNGRRPVAPFAGLLKHKAAEGVRSSTVGIRCGLCPDYEIAVDAGHDIVPSNHVSGTAIVPGLQLCRIRAHPMGMRRGDTAGVDVVVGVFNCEQRNPRRIIA